MGRLVLGVLLALAGGCKLRASATADLNAGADVDVRVDAHVSTTVKIRRQGDQLVDDGEIRFDFASAALDGSRTEDTLRSYANKLRGHPEVQLRIEGHTDSRGTPRYNRRLSDERAHAVRDWLIEKGGIADDRLTAVGRGEEQPLLEEPIDCKNRDASAAPAWCDERAWSHNRRSEFHITAGADTLPDGDVTENRVAAPAPTGPAFSTGPYVYLSPAFLRVAAATTVERELRKPSYRWGFGAGYLWRRRAFAFAWGIGFAHVPVAVEQASDRCMTYACFSAHEVVIDAELRLGAGSRRVLGYGLLGPGLAIGRSQGPDGRVFTTLGFSGDLGVGIWGLVWRGLFLGGEVAMNFAAHSDLTGAFHDTARVAGFDLRFLLGWHFGWKG